MPKPVSPELLDFKAQLDLYRQSHPKRSRLPEHLWQQAASLLARHSVSAICRLTHLHPEGLRKRADPSATKMRPPLPSHSFLQLDPAALPNSAPERAVAAPNIPATSGHAPAYRLVVERPDGSRLSLQLPNSEWSQVEAFCSLFWRS